MGKLALLLDTWGALSPAQAKQAGAQGQMFYVPTAGAPSKSPTRADLEDFTAAGLVWGWVYEADPRSPLGGAPAARRDWDAMVSGLESLGVGLPPVVYFPMDAEVPQGGETPLLEYFSELVKLAPPTTLPGVYGSDTICQWTKQTVKRWWQTGAGSQSVLTWAHIYQGAPKDVFGWPQVTVQGRLCDQDPVWSALAGLENLNGPWPKGDAVLTKLIAIQAGSDGQAEHLVDVPFADLVSVTAVNGLGPHQVTASVAQVPGHPQFSFAVVKGASAHQVVEVLVAYQPPAPKA